MDAMIGVVGCCKAIHIISSTPHRRPPARDPKQKWKIIVNSLSSSRVIFNCAVGHSSAAPSSAFIMESSFVIPGIKPWPTSHRTQNTLTTRRGEQNNAQIFFARCRKPMSLLKPGQNLVYLNRLDCICLGGRREQGATLHELRINKQSSFQHN